MMPSTHVTTRGTVAVLGAGTMGSGIAAVFALAGYPVNLFDSSDTARQAALPSLTLDLERAVRRGVVDRDAAKAAVDRISICESLADACEAAGLVVEAVVEDLSIKQELFREVSRTAPTEALLATNTSALSISAIASATGNPTRVLGLHFFNPPVRMQLVEVVRGLDTSEETVEVALRWLAATGKQTVVVRETPGFATSRISAMVGNEAFYMLQEGVASAEEIDTAIRLGLNHPMGPLELGDLVGLDVRLGILRHLHRTLGEKFRPCPLLVQYVDAGRLGRKTGCGVFEYDAKGHRVRTDHGAAS